MIDTGSAYFWPAAGKAGILDPGDPDGTLTNRAIGTITVPTETYFSNNTTRHWTVNFDLGPGNTSDRIVAMGFNLQYSVLNLNALTGFAPNDPSGVTTYTLFQSTQNSGSAACSLP